MKVTLVCLLLLAFATQLTAQHRLGRDPLSPEETDKLRDTAVEPNKRLKLYVEFARARVTSMEQVAADPKAKDNPKQMHDLLEDFSILIDEISDNVDMFHGQHWDIRKALKLVIEGETEFQLKLRKLSEPSGNPPAADQTDAYKFVLRDALESLNNGADDARHAMQEQNALAKDKKLKKEEAN
jgi:regulator of replication initiation timing